MDHLTAKRRIKQWRDDPVLFVKDNFGIDPDEWQKDFLLAYNSNRRTAAKACKGPGKTAVLAWCAWHFLATRPFPKIAATSISGDNLRDGLWAEMSKWQSRSEFLKQAFQWTKERIFSKQHPENWFMSARQWSKSADKDQQANTLAGLHADYIMFIIDEGGGIPDAVMAAAEAALATGKECKIIMAGNPTHLTGPLYRACTKERTLWKVVEITGDPDDPKRSKRIDPLWAREQMMKYGADNPWVLVNVFGQFPPASLNALIGPDEVEKAMKRTLKPESYNWAAKILGGDIARQGDDASTICPRQGLVCFKPKILRVPDTIQVAGHFAAAINKWKPDGVNIDATGGYGVGVIDALRSWGHAVNEVHFSGKALDPKFFNTRSEIIWKFVHWIKAGGCLPYLPELTEELTAITYTFVKDKIRIIEKDQVKELIGRSTDLTDGYATTFAFDIAAKDALAPFRGPNKDDINPVEQFALEAQRQNGYEAPDDDPLKNF